MRPVPTLLAFWTASVCAQVPVTLKAGDKATAAEVMQNFKYLDSLTVQTQKDLSKLQGVVIGNQSDLSATKAQLESKADTASISGLLKTVDSNGFTIGQRQGWPDTKLQWTGSELRIRGTGEPWNGTWISFDENSGSGVYLGNYQARLGITFKSYLNGPGLWIGLEGRSFSPRITYLFADKEALHFPNQVYADNGIQVQGNLATSGDVQVGGTLSVQAKQIAPDYVFAPDYPLMPLGELATYVSENRHLPDVPDAGTIATQGVDVAQMNLVLLRKVEELTLHLIALQQQVDSLKSR